MRKKKEERIGRHKKDQSDYTKDEYHYERTVEDTGKLTEKIYDSNHKQTYERTVEDTGNLTEKIFDDKYERTIDSSSGNLTETVSGEMTLESGGKMTLKTVNGPIEINAADENKNVIIKANRREEYTKSEWEVNHFGNKFQLSGGASEEIFFGPLKFESIDAVTVGIAAAAAFDWNFLFKLEGSLINILVDNLVIKESKIAEIKKKGAGCTIVQAAEIIL